VIFGLFVHPGTQTFFLWQQHAFGSQADSSSDDGEDEAEDEEDVEEDEDSSPRSLWFWRQPALWSDKYQFNLSTSMSWRNLAGSRMIKQPLVPIRVCWEWAREDSASA